MEDRYITDYIANAKALSHVRGNPDDYAGFSGGDLDGGSDYQPEPLIRNGVTYKWHGDFSYLGNDGIRYYTTIYEADNGFRISRNGKFHCTLTDDKNNVIAKFYDYTL